MISKNIEQFCKNYKDIKNYSRAVEDPENVWDCHHRLETHFSNGTERPKNAQLLKEELEALDMYYYRPADEFVFLKHSEHISLHKEGGYFGRKAKTIYYFDGRGWNSSTVDSLANSIKTTNRNITETSAQQKVRRLLKTSELLDQATPCVVGKETWFIGYKRDLQLGRKTTTYVSLEDKDIPNKLLRKFANNYKRHGEEPGKKWSVEDVGLYKVYCDFRGTKV